MVTSKPKRISVAAGFVHMMSLLNGWLNKQALFCLLVRFITLPARSDMSLPLTMRIDS